MHTESFEMWRWKRMNKTSRTYFCEKWGSYINSQGETDSPTYNEKKEAYLDWSHLVYDLSFKTLYWKKEKPGRQGRTRQQLLDDFKETKGYWKVKNETQGSTVRRTVFGRGYGPATRHYRRNRFTYVDTQHRLHALVWLWQTNFIWNIFVVSYTVLSFI